MTNEQLQKDKRIVAEVPENTTHVDDYEKGFACICIDEDGCWWEWIGDEWQTCEQFTFDMYDNIRSLSDIKARIADQEKIEDLIAYINALESAGNKMKVNLAYSQDGFANSYRALWVGALKSTPEWLNQQASALQEGE